MRNIFVGILLLFMLHSRAETSDTIPPHAARSVTLDEVVVVGGREEAGSRLLPSLNVVRVGLDRMDEQRAGSLMQTLDGVPGVRAMHIGSGQSKPLIRGMGFNRVLVVENGLRHEGQQWGDDHGLEIDQFAVDRVEIIKGPAALFYGSDAIGGVVSLHSRVMPMKPFEAGVRLFAQTGNASAGLSARVGGRRGRHYYKVCFTVVDYADYKVMTDSVRYYSYRIPLRKRRLRNTAGREYDGSMTWGYIGENFSTRVDASLVHLESGFFADAHGLEVRLSDIDYDRSSRDVDLPCQRVNHVKLTNHSLWQTGGVRWESRVAYQANWRKELSEAVSHGYMPLPPGNVERSFRKQTLAAGIGLEVDVQERHRLQAGLTADFQHNRRGGWGFILPAFEALSLGGYLLDRYTLSDALTLNAGIRVDRASLHVHRYRDWFLTPVADADSVYKERSPEGRWTFRSLTWSVGGRYVSGAWTWKANVGKSFRVPQPQEVGADGVNYHVFRYEKGMPDLQPEESYQLDAGMAWRTEQAHLHLEPFVNYFPNYIYLLPTAGYTEGLQTYVHTQSRVFRWGFEAGASYWVLPRLEVGVQGEYLYAVQLSGAGKGTALPFSPPWRAGLELKYVFPSADGTGDGFVGCSCTLVGRRNRIVPPELPTAGYGLVNVSAGKAFAWKGHRMSVHVQGLNLLGKRYYDATSYYRLIDVPGPGRQFSVLLGMEL